MGSVATTKSVNVPPTSIPTSEGPSVSEAPEAGIGDAGMMRWRGDAQETEVPRHNQPPCTTELMAAPVEFPARRRSTFASKKPHGVVTIVVTT